MIKSGITVGSYRWLMVLKVRVIAPYRYYAYAERLLPAWYREETSPAFLHHDLTGLRSEGLASGGDRARSYPIMLTSIKEP